MSKQNMTIVEDNKKIVVFSYSTPVIVVLKRSASNQLYVTNQKYSVTTSKHINQFLSVNQNGVPSFVDETMIRKLAGDLQISSF